MRVQVVDDLSAAIRDYNSRGYRVDALWPADGPRVATLSGPEDDLELRLDPDGLGLPVPVQPVQARLWIRRPAEAAWETGRAGMAYRDLIPDRLGGRFIASHIRIPGAGPVPDQVHFHDIRFQLIFCVEGAVRLVYEDQGQPFWMTSGQGVLQPPGIRHRVLESRDDLEVLEVACPAVHKTSMDHDLVLPSGPPKPDRRFEAQRFARFDAALPDTWDAFSAAADNRLRCRITDAIEPHSGALQLSFVLRGRAVLVADGRSHPLGPKDAVTLPAGSTCSLGESTENFALFEVSVP